MKKVFAIFLCILMCYSLSPKALAADSRDISLETTLASQLKELGLFQGVGENDDGTTDFELSRMPSRTEALIMLLRALGKGAAAEVYPKTHPFSDVPTWADGYVSYAYDNGLTNGVSDTLFGAKSVATAEMYLTFMLRALGYSDGDYGEFTWNAPWALAAWCGILPTQVDWTDFLRADVVIVTSAALYADIKGTQTPLHERLAAEGAFTEERFDAAFPAYPFEKDRLIDGQISAAIAANYPLGETDENVYATECHVITDITEIDDVLTVSVLVCCGEFTLYKNGYLNDSSSVAPWLIKLDANTLQLKSCRLAYELKEEGLSLTDCFSEKTLAALDLLRFPMRDVCKMELQMKMDSGIITYKQPTYEEALAKATASFSTITQTLEADCCTILLGKPAGQQYYEYQLYLVFKPSSIYQPDSVRGEGDTELIASSSEGDLWLSEDGLTLYYSYHFENGAVYVGFPPTGGDLPERGTCLYTIALDHGETAIQVTAD